MDQVIRVYIGVVIIRTELEELADVLFWLSSSSELSSDILIKASSASTQPLARNRLSWMSNVAHLRQNFQSHDFDCKQW
ncbi:hypothetical protein RIR_jg11104.t1 [Rhizophagus irregularis DAOM 181602=DAOM 197198]|nr:hypothetical protein RIR_jg11104.t1 [Rhizophagus irregularis DAOM 181602=DAOM 197198]